MIPKRLLVTLATLLVLIAGTIVAIRYAQGYRFSRQTVVKATGLLSANSFPTGASVYVNGELKSATDTTINLTPGEYEIEIRKEGYFSWKKKLQLESELVTQTNALLFPTAPGLTPLTFIGAHNIHPSPDGQRILFTTASASAARNNGLYVIDLTDNPLALQKGPRQIARSTPTTDLNRAQLLWSPDGDQILVRLGARTYLLDANRLTDLETAKDVSASLDDTLTTWAQLINKKQQTQLAKFPLPIVNIATGSASLAFISPDQERILYTATADAVLADRLAPPVQASNSQPQERMIKAGNTYVYDRREDRNFLVKTGVVTPTPTPTPNKKTTKPLTSLLPVQTSNQQALTPDTDNMNTTIAEFQKRYSSLYLNGPQWLPDSKHLIFLDTAAIRISEYDGTNMTQVYAGPLSGGFVYPWPNGTKLLILTNFNQSSEVPLNLYAVSLR